LPCRLLARAEVLPAVFKARPMAISFEAANPRHEHEWKDLRKLRIPDDKVRDRGTDCGFGTFTGFSAIMGSVGWLKLADLAEGARLASDRLWQTGS
jgi:5-methyltetrahydropteroyltriglutamate--homocysteine methyltransferase